MHGKEDPLGLTEFDAAEYLSDEQEIAEFLTASAEIGDPEVFLNALGTVARARGMTELAQRAGLGRESLYKAFKPGAHPRYDTIFKLASALGVHMTFQAAQPRPSKAVQSSKPRRRSRQGAR